MTRLILLLVLVSLYGCAGEASQSVTNLEIESHSDNQQAASPPGTVVSDGHGEQDVSSGDPHKANPSGPTIASENDSQRVASPHLSDWQPKLLVPAEPIQIPGATAGPAAALKLTFLPVDRIHEKSMKLEWHTLSYQFSEDGSQILVIGSYRSNRGLYRCDISTKEFVEYGTYDPQNLGGLKADVRPNFYEYLTIPEPYEHPLVFIRNDCLYFANRGDGQQGWTLESTNWTLRDHQKINLPPFYLPGAGWDGPDHNQHFITIDNRGLATTFSLAFDGSVQKYYSAPTRDPQNSRRRLKPSVSVIATSPNHKAIAAFNAPQYSLFMSDGLNANTVTFELDNPLLKSRKVFKHFFANDNKWFCILHKPDQSQTNTFIDYYDTSTGRRLGSYPFPRTNFTDYRLDDSRVVQDRSGKQLVITEPAYFDKFGSKHFFCIENDKFVLVADSIATPELGKLGMPVALSPDGQRLAFYGRSAEEEPIELGILEMDDLKKLSSGEASDVRPVPSGNYLASLKQEDIDPELRSSHDHPNLVHIIPGVENKKTMFSPNDRWLCAGSVLYDFATRTRYDLEQLVKQHTNEIYVFDNFAFTPDSKRMLFFTRNSILVFDMENITPRVLTSVPMAREKGFVHSAGAYRIVFLPPDPTQPDTYHVLLGTWEEIGFLQFNDEFIEQLNYRDVKRAEMFSYTEDVKEVVLAEGPGGFKAYDPNNELKATDILSFDQPRQSNIKYLWMSAPLDHFVFQEGRKSFVCQLRDGQFTSPQELAMRIRSYFTEGSRDWLEFKLETRGDEFVKLGMYNPQQNVLLTAEIANEFRDRVDMRDIADDQHHIALYVDEQIHILRTEFRTVTATGSR